MTTGFGFVIFFIPLTFLAAHGTAQDTFADLEDKYLLDSISIGETANVSLL